MAHVPDQATVTYWQKLVHQLAVEKGWWDEKGPKEKRADRFLAVIAIMHTRLSGVLEEVRNGSEVLYTPNLGVVKAFEVVGNLSEDQISTLAKLALVHSELSEAVEAVVSGQEEMYFDEKGKPEGAVVEVVDAIIRMLDLAGRNHWKTEEAMSAKHAYNMTRPHRHGGKLA